MGANGIILRAGQNLQVECGSDDHGVPKEVQVVAVPFTDFSPLTEQRTAVGGRRPAAGGLMHRSLSRARLRGAGTAGSSGGQWRDRRQAAQRAAGGEQQAGSGVMSHGHQHYWNAIKISSFDGWAGGSATGSATGSGRPAGGRRPSKLAVLMAGQGAAQRAVQRAAGGQQAAGSRQQAAGSRRHVAGGMWQAAGDGRQAAGGGRQEAGAVGGRQRASVSGNVLAPSGKTRHSYLNQRPS
ncbi:hypothetical protein GGX14DRAFT_678101 [Mycena pura]|uniref:Uncharacterized protein n=1 Tax=Mycena pura TaxID=153505 RepID=A0AAD6V1D5_9AGAR|nr:hypothetical protein GGX14DRAFT_678101 [Mycena pura]